jgi:single-stranded DNA-binding protein
MADSAKKPYVTAVGFVQFDPVVREANGKSVTDLVVKLPGGEQTMVRITVWPEIQVDGIAKGDFIAVDGQFSSNTYQANDGTTKTSLQISAFNLAVLGKAAARAERDVVAGAAPAGTTDKVPF